MEAIKDRVRALRLRLKMTQEACASRGGIKRDEWSKVENGHNYARSHEMRVSLARGLQIPVEVLDDYIDGKISLQDAAGASGEVRAAPKPHRTQFEIAVDFAQDDWLLPQTIEAARRWGEEHPEASASLNKLGWYRKIRDIDADLRMAILDTPAVSVATEKRRKVAG